MRLLMLAGAAAALLPGQVSFERIVKAPSDPGNWLTYSGAYNGHRYSPLKEIHTGNVKRLVPVWAYQTNDLNKFETSPLVVDGVMYISEPPNKVAALDARTGRPLWQYRRNLPSDIRPCCGQVNRGLAILGDSLFMGTLDSHVIALDSRTGRVRWDVPVADHRMGYAMTAAPLALKNQVVVGVAGGEYGIRGLLDSYDAETGRRLWRLWTVPGPGEPGNETWAGDSWKTGSAATWITGSYDPELDLVYWGTGNPGPDYNGDVRKGDNLYANSLLAVEAATGKLRWHFQFTPHDVHDWDSNHVPVLVDGGRKLAAVANRNGFYYVFDRVNGKFLRGVPYAKQTWAKGLDERGRPIRLPDTTPTGSGVIVYPGLHGGTNWFSPSYSTQTGLFYVATRLEGTLFYSDVAKYQPGQWFSAGGIRGIPGVEPTGSIQALEFETGKQVWEFKLQSPPWAGLMSTAGGLVLGGSSEGYFFALDARTGKPLWRFPAGGPIFGNPVSFMSQGKQHIATAAGHTLFVFALLD